MTGSHSRMIREKEIVETMIRMYCHHMHDTGNALCNDCHDLLQYASQRLDKCPFQEQKPTCSKCPVHCYKPEMRGEVRKVMKHSGPRMVFRHPVQAVRHLIDGKKRPLNPKDVG